MSLPPNLQNIVTSIVDSGRDEISLDELAEMVIGDANIGQGELEVLIEHLEQRGIDVADSVAAAPAQKILATVFTSAHALREQLGRAPAIDEIATATGLPRVAVEAALAHARRVSETGVAKATGSGDPQ